MNEAQKFIAALHSKEDKDMGFTDWYCYDQTSVSQHGATSGDDGPVHNDAEWCKANTPYGGTIVQGSLLLSTLTHMAKSLVWPEADMRVRLNYGYDKVRIIQPIKTGQRFRGKFTFSDASPKGEQAALIKVGVTLDGEGEEGPALMAEWLFYIQFGS